MVRSSPLTVAVLAATTTALAAAPTGMCPSAGSGNHACWRSAAVQHQPSPSCCSEHPATPTAASALPGPCHCVHEAGPPAVEESAVHGGAHSHQRGPAATAAVEPSPRPPCSRIEPVSPRTFEATGPPLYTTACALLI